MSDLKKPKAKSQSKRRHTLELSAVIVFLAFNVFAPFFIGECFPVTISPMFCDQPESYCRYKVTDPEGNELDLEYFSLHQVYDGNPPGLGVGLKPRLTINIPGQVASEQLIVRYVKKGLRNVPDIPWVNVEQRVFGQVDGSIGEVQDTNTWKIDRSGIIE